MLGIISDKVLVDVEEEFHRAATEVTLANEAIHNLADGVVELCAVEIGIAMELLGLHEKVAKHLYD